MLNLSYTPKDGSFNIDFAGVGRSGIKILFLINLARTTTKTPIENANSNEP